MTNPNMSADEALAVMDRTSKDAQNWFHIQRPRAPLRELDAYREDCVKARTAVAALIAERDALAARVKELEAEQDAAQEIVAIFADDAQRWRGVASMYDAAKTSNAVLVLRGLGLEETPYRSLAENIDAARAEASNGP